MENPGTKTLFLTVLNEHPSIPWVLPFVFYLLLSQAVVAFAPESLYPWLHLGAIFITAVVTFSVIRGRGLVKPHWDIIPGVICGIAGLFLWIYLCSLDIDGDLVEMLPQWIRPGPRAAFNPFESIENPGARWFFIAGRMAGMSLLVPVAEELFWRGWLMRWVVSHDWQKVPVGQFTPASFFWVTFLFTMAHPEWLAAACWCVMINLLLYWKKDLWNCMVAHGVTNFMLAVYVMKFDAWQLW